MHGMLPRVMTVVAHSSSGTETVRRHWTGTYGATVRMCSAPKRKRKRAASGVTHAEGGGGRERGGSLGTGNLHRIKVLIDSEPFSASPSFFSFTPLIGRYVVDIQGLSLGEKHTVRRTTAPHHRNSSRAAARKTVRTVLYVRKYVRMHRVLRTYTYAVLDILYSYFRTPYLRTSPHRSCDGVQWLLTPVRNRSRPSRLPPPLSCRPAWPLPRTGIVPV